VVSSISAQWSMVVPVVTLGEDYSSSWDRQASESSVGIEGDQQDEVNWPGAGRLKLRRSRFAREKRNRPGDTMVCGPS
jgi:hypothetical protein